MINRVNSLNRANTVPFKFVHFKSKLNKSDNINEFYKNANSIEELVRYMPSRGDWILSQKSEALSGDRYYTIGGLNGFADKETFRQLSEAIKKTHRTPNRIEGEFKIGENGFRIKYPANGLSGKIVAEIKDSPVKI